MELFTYTVSVTKDGKEAAVKLSQDQVDNMSDEVLVAWVRTLFTSLQKELDA